MKFHDDKTDLYYMKGLLKCPVHGVSLTAYGARGRNGKIHHYYLCTKCGSEQRHKIDDVHISIEEVLLSIQVSSQSMNLYRKILEKIFDREDNIRKDAIEKIKKEIERTEVRKSNLQNRLMDNDITPSDYQSMKEKVDKELILQHSKLDELFEQKSPYKTYITKTIPLLENLVSFYRKSNGITKRKILGCIFEENIVFEKGRVATTPFTTPILVLLNATKVLRSPKNKKEVENDLLSIMAPPAGLEPATL